MKLTGDSLFDRVRRVAARLRPRGLPFEATLAEPPLRSELFSADQMEQHGRYLAESHVLATGRAPDQLLPRLAANEEILLRVFEQLTEAVTAGRRVTPASDWLLDNFYLIEEQIRTAKRHLPRNYSRELPRLVNGASAGFPRVWDIALETIAHGDGRVDLVGLTRFIAAYESVSPLDLGELWAIPIMLRLALIENLRRVALRIAAGRIDRDLASQWVRAMITTVDRDPKSLILVVADMARSKPPMSAPFVSEFVRGLQGQSPALAMALTWVEQRLAEDGLSTEQLVQSGNQIQAADQVTIGNSIGSLRFLASVDWRTFVEFMSVVDQALRGAPDDCYARMDFGTRNRYRRVIERIARRSEHSEQEVAEAALRLVREAAARTDAEDGERARRAHVGYYLVGRGLDELERAVRYRRTLAEFARSSVERVPLLAYLGTITAITATSSGWLGSIAYADGVVGWRLALMAVIAVVATSQLAVALVNWLATLLVTPSALPRMDFSTGIPASSSALVVIPTMISSTRNIDELVEALEVRFLANRDANLRFGLLTDFADAADESMPEDGPLLEHAARRIDALNAFYACDAFFLFHRPRRWNPGERAWMGFERKRGKLADLNWLLREADPANASDRFSLVVGDTKLLAGTRYVITLDTDTQLPRDAARQFVGTMAHPLNRPVFDDRLGRVRAGHGILQPRVSPSLPGTNRSRYARMHSGEPGIDPYTRTVSDVYQDLFDEGSFIGKGIYDVDAFERAMNGRFPDNRILSHDLLEGCYARSGLVSDLELFEDYPATYSSDTARRHRWIRGDWQIASWLLRRVPGPAGQAYRNPLSPLSRWKIADNLRRSLVPIAQLLLLLAAWTALPSVLAWTLAVVGMILVPALLDSVRQLFRKPPEATVRQHLDVTIRTAAARCAHAGLTLACLPYEAYVSADAVVRTTWRTLISHRRLLEWNPYSAHAGTDEPGLLSSIRSMWMAPAVALATGAYLVTARPSVLGIAAPILLLWLAAPGITAWLNRPLVRPESRLTQPQQEFLQVLARRTWAFFETFVGPDDHWLPPDNVQKQPGPMVAHRTSPTNMGLALLANLVAHDFGYLPTGRLLERTARALRSMASLERHRGHFYNWYDTRSLQPLLPMYVSTVDSGNLAAHLLTLRVGLLALPDEPIVPRRVFAGLGDTLGVVTQLQAGDATKQQMELRRELDLAIAAGVTTPGDARRRLDRLVVLAGELAATGGSAAVATPTDAIAQQDWTRMLLDHCLAARDDLAARARWTSLPSPPAGLETLLPHARVPTLREVAGLEERVLPIIERELAADRDASTHAWLRDFRVEIAASSAVRTAGHRHHRGTGPAG